MLNPLQSDSVQATVTNCVQCVRSPVECDTGWAGGKPSHHTDPYTQVGKPRPRGRGAGTTESGTEMDPMSLFPAQSLFIPTWPQTNGPLSVSKESLLRVLKVNAASIRQVGIANPGCDAWRWTCPLWSSCPKCKLQTKQGKTSDNPRWRNIFFRITYQYSSTAVLSLLGTRDHCSCENLTPDDRSAAAG